MTSKEHHSDCATRRGPEFYCDCSTWEHGINTRIPDKTQPKAPTDEEVMGLLWGLKDKLPEGLDPMIYVTIGMGTGVISKLIQEKACIKADADVMAIALKRIESGEEGPCAIATEALNQKPARSHENLQRTN